MARKRERESSREDIELHRLDGAVVSLGCESCPILSLCGGNTRVGGGMCETRCSGCDPATCDLVCLGKPEVFARAVMEVGGFELDDIGPLLAPEEALPRYAPMIYNGSSRTRPLKEEWAAIPLSAIFQHPRGVPTPVARTPRELREWFQLGPHTKIILMGIGLDHTIERYWRERNDAGLSEQLAVLGVGAAVVPNYSISLRHPRPQHLFNRKRSLICAEEWSAQGIPSVPYLQAVTPRDWEVWGEFLEARPEVSIVAKEFETGLANPREGLKALYALARLQDKLKRPLHLLARGGAQYRKEFSHLFESWTLVDSNPFIKAVKRKKARMDSRRVDWDNAPDHRVDALLAHNIGVWRRWISTPYVPAARTPQAPKSAEVHPGQLRIPGT
jgi:hypothetical protein